MEGEGVRQRKGRRDQESQIERGDVGEERIERGRKRNPQRDKERRGGKKTDRRLFIIVKLQTDEAEGRNMQDDGRSLLLKKAWKEDKSPKTRGEQKLRETVVR